MSNGKLLRRLICSGAEGDLDAFRGNTWHTTRSRGDGGGA